MLSTMVVEAEDLHEHLPTDDTDDNNRLLQCTTERHQSQSYNLCTRP